MSILIVCSGCQQHIVNGTLCPNCESSPKQSRLSLAVLLGIGLMGCGDKDQDSADGDAEPAEEPASEPADAALYGVASE